MKPTYYPKKMRVNDYEVEASHPWNLTERCLEGSIPIEKTPKNSHFRYVSSKSHWLKDRHYVFGQRRMQVSKYVSDNHEHSSIHVLGSNYYGAKASINVWNPKVENQQEFSLSHISFNSEDGKSSLAAGWMVNPSIYGSNKTRFFTYWVTDVDNSLGCFNLGCPGFVQTDHKTLLSGYLQPISVYGGPQYSIDVEIFQDTGTGNWWLRLEGAEMGYWPKEVVPSLAKGAVKIVWGGQVGNMQSDQTHTGTQMGSGHYSNEGFKKASFFKSVQVLDSSLSSGYSYPDHSSVVIESTKCYDLQVGGKTDGLWGYFFFYGGPGRSNICT